MKIDLKVRNILAFLLVAPTAYAAADSTKLLRAINDFEMEKISQAKTSQELDSWLVKIQSLRVDLIACDLQLQQGLVPVRCFAVNVSANEWHLELPKEYSAEHLLATCQALASSTKQSEVSDINLLPTECLVKVQRTMEINKYKAASLPGR